MCVFGQYNKFFCNIYYSFNFIKLNCLGTYIFSDIFKIIEYIKLRFRFMVMQGICWFYNNVIVL